MKLVNVILMLLFFITLPVNVQTAKGDMIAEWTFDDIEGRRVKDHGSGSWDFIDGHFDIVDGVVGKAIKCDGFTTSIARGEPERDEDDEDENEDENEGERYEQEISDPVIAEAFTIEAWVAPQAYPWNWCAVYNQEYKKARGVFFGIDGEGRVGLHTAVTRQWRECVSQDKIPFMAWSYIAATFHPESGMRVYINGQLSGELHVKGDLLYDREFPMQIARNHEPMSPSSLNRAGFVNVPVKYSFDGIIDELKITRGVLDSSQLLKNYQRLKPSKAPELVWRKLPKIPTDNAEFGAFYTKLNYDADWDRLWRDDRFPDIVITFDEQKYSMVFWKGTNYNMNLITENGKWIGDQSAETFGEFGCMEHMSDKQNRYSHVRLIENSDARIVVHWRYALTDINYTIANTDSKTNWGDWADEYYYVYPDGIAVRHYLIHGIENGGYSVTEPALFCSPGEKPEDNIDMVAVTVANLAGKTSSHSFETWPAEDNNDDEEVGRFKNSVDNEVLSVINVKSKAKPFFIYEHENSIGPYGGGKREIDYRLSKFHWRNHWPVTQIPSDGRFILSNDRVTSSAITSPRSGIKRETENGPLEGRFILGISEEPAEALVPFARFWINTPKLKINSQNFTYNGFSRNDRAYHFTKNDSAATEIAMTVSASESSPLVNPVFVVKNWNSDSLKLKINGAQQKESDGVKYSIRKTLESQDLIVWLELNENKTTKLTFRQ